MDTTRRAAWLWTLTFLGYPPAGFVARAVGGPVDDATSALVAGTVAGAVVGIVQWLVGRRWGLPLTWVPVTAAGLAVGLALAQTSGVYDVELGALAATGAVTGAAVGAGQALLLRPGRLRSLWAPAQALLWAAGWATTTLAGIDVDQRWAVFGASGALVCALGSAALVATLGGRREPEDAR